MNSGGRSTTNGVNNGAPESNPNAATPKNKKSVSFGTSTKALSRA
jgi:hypothetical protein